MNSQPPLPMLLEMIVRTTSRYANPRNPEESMSACLAELNEAIRSCRYTAQDMKRRGLHSRRIDRLLGRYTAWRATLERVSAAKGVRLRQIPPDPRLVREWLEARLALAIGETEEACALLEQADRRICESVERLTPWLFTESISTAPAASAA